MPFTIGKIARIFDSSCKQKAFSKPDNVTKSCGAAFLATSPSAMRYVKERDDVEDRVV